MGKILKHISKVLCGSSKGPNSTNLLETLAELEHDQWIEWSKSVASEVSPERRKRWETYWVPYSELTEEVKEQDRKYARKILEVLK